MFLEDKSKFVEPIKADPLDVVALRLMRAADIIRMRGWVQVVACRKGAVCLMGAIFDVQGDSRIIPAGLQRDNIADLAAGYMIKLGFNAGWNDEPGRTASEVIRALEDAALLRREPPMEWEQ